jgi:hypothetical protein
VKTVPLYGKKAAGRIALVDDEDYELVMQRRWYLWESPQRSGGPYAVTALRLAEAGRSGAMAYMHKMLTGWEETDHINGNGLDNQRSNLRPVTRKQNQHHRRGDKGTSSRFKGVHWEKRTGKWRAGISGAGVGNLKLGRFASEEEAARAYDDAARQHYGEYAYLNFPDES